MKVIRDIYGRSTPAAIFVWSVWALMTFLAFDFVAKFAVNVPYYDEWEMVPALTGAQRVTLSWLWTQHNEHRILLARLVYLLVAKLTGGDFRAGMYLNAAVLSGFAALLIVAFRRLRGETAYEHAFLPMILMCLGQAQTLANGFQLAFVIATVVFLVALLLVATREQVTPRRALALGVCVAVLPTLGGPGLAVVPCLGLCALLVAWDLQKRQGQRAVAAALVSLVGLGVFLLALYFVHYQRPAKHPTSPGLDATIVGSFEFLLAGFGSASRFLWPSAGVLEVGLVLLTAALCIHWVWVGRDRPRMARLLLFLGAMLCLAFGTAWARVALGPGLLFSSRYVALAIPFWCAIYLVWELAGARSPRARLAQQVLFFGAAVLAVANQRDGATEAVFFHDARKIVVDDIKAGRTAAEIVARQYPLMYYGDPQALIERLRLLKAKRIGVFRDMKD